MSSTIADLKRRLDDWAEDVLADLYGKPTKRLRSELRWGRRGSMQLIRRRGRWRWIDFESGERGSVLDAIMSAQGLDFDGAIRWAQDWLGGEPPDRPRPKRAAPADVDDDQAQRERQAAAIWEAGRPVADTLAGEYLRQHRAIEADFPSRVARYVEAADIKRCRPQWRDWWRWPALVLAATGAAGIVTAVQLVALEPGGRAAPHWDNPKRKLKLTLGRLRGSAVRLPGLCDATAPLLLGEGFEATASGWWGAGFEAQALLGSIANAQLDDVPVTRPILVLADDDARNAPANRGLNKAIAGWRREGRTVLKVKPWSLTRGDKSDLNDLLQADGREAVRQRIMAAIEAVPVLQLPAVDDARRDVALAIGKALLELRQWRDSQSEGDGAIAPFKLVRAALGLGKTTIAIQQVVDAVSQGERVVYLVPTHKLGVELQDRVQAEMVRQGVDGDVDIWRGRAAAHPARPAEPMCEELDTVRAAQEAHLDPARVVCEVCPNRDGCPYLAQFECVADVWIGAHELLLNAPPAPLRGATLLVIDEGFAHRLGIIGTAGAPLLLTRNDILDEPSLKSPAVTADLLADLMPPRRKLAAALDGHPEGGLDRDRLLAAGITVDEAAKAHDLEWTAKVEPHIDEHTTWRSAKARIARAGAANQRIGKQAMAWREVEAMLRDETATRSGRAIREQLETGDGATFAALRLYGLENIDEAWQRVPTLNLDATADITLLRARVPHAALVARVEASVPHMKVFQYVGHTFGKSALHDERTLGRAWDWVGAHASRRGGNWLVVLGKDAEAMITSTRTLPPFIRTAHFGALRGLDEHREVTGIIVIGRPMPTPADVERLAGILSGREVQHRVEGWYPAEMVHLHARDGTSATVEADRHPDDLAEAVRVAIAEAELVQAIGRVRGVNRTAENPAEVVLLGNVPVPGLALDSVRPWQAPSVDDEILTRHGVEIEGAADVATATGLTLRQVKDRRERLAAFPYKSSLYENAANLCQAIYQRNGPGHRRRWVRWDPRRVPDLRGWLEARLGTLAYFERIESAPPDPSAEVLPSWHENRAFRTGSPELPPKRDPVELPIAAEAAAVEALATVPVAFSVEDELLEPVVVPLAAAVEALPSAMLDYRGGLLPKEVRNLSRESRRAAGISQEALARLIRISRPQLANAEAGRFGLSPEAAERLLAAIASLPVRQPSLLWSAP